MKRIMYLFVVLLFLAGCGEGSGEGGDSNIESTQEPPCPENAEMFSEHDQTTWHYVEELCDNGSVISNSCQSGNVYRNFGDRFDEVCEYLGERAVEPSTEEIPQGATSYECPNRFDFSDFLYDTLNGETEIHHASGVDYIPGETEISRFDGRPEIGIAEGTTNFQENVLRKAVGTINGALPDEYDIRILPERVPARTGRPPNGQIYIDFAPLAEWPGNNESLARTPAGTTVVHKGTGSTRSAHIWVNSEATEHFSQDRMLWLIYHELFHALGFARHTRNALGRVGSDHFAYNSVLWSILPREGIRLSVGERRGNVVQLGSKPFQFRENGILYPVDWWGLKYLYEELETGDSTEFYQGPDDLTYPEFDYWLREKGC